MELIKGSSQGFGFAIGMMIGFGLVAYMSSKAFDAKMRSVIGDFDTWLIAQTDKLNNQAEESNLRP